jgi:hypothetical protein
MAIYNVQNLNIRPKICISCGAQGEVPTAFLLGNKASGLNKPHQIHQSVYPGNRVGEAMRSPCLRSETCETGVFN